jgi:hypothetical protein
MVRGYKFLNLHEMKQASELNIFRAFRSRNYTLYFIGRAVSQFGTWMQRTAVVWLVYSLAQSAFLIGVAIFAEIFPSFLSSVAGGVAADRYDRYTIIRITQVASMIQSVGLADLPNALSLTTATASLAQLLGAALAGIVLSAFGAAV